MIPLSFLLFLTLLNYSPSADDVIRPPAGTQSVPGLYKVFLDKTEVTNNAWREYLNHLSADTSSVAKAYPDTAIWQQAYQGKFWKDENYGQYPIVGISYQQAIAYCQWRSEYTSDREKRPIEYSLPNMKVLKMTHGDQNDNKIAEGLYSTSMGFRSFLGLCDNASEMTSKEGVAIRGSNRLHCLETYDYVVPSPSLGFRCMAELK